MCYSFYGDTMNNVKRSLVINILIIVVSFVLFKGVSYSLDNNPTNDNKDVLIQTGNMQVILNVPSEKYELLDFFKDSVSDSVGLNQEGYNFSVKNTGNIPIEYYEIRLVDQEGKISTLPHKYLRFSISCDNKKEDIKNLGDNDSIIYSGYNLDVGKSIAFNLKMWIDENEAQAFGKELYGAIEITLYQKYDVYKNYVLYESNVGSINVPVRTSIYSPVTSTIPKRNGYYFVGWEKKGTNIRYYPGDVYEEEMGTTLYAIWEKE